MTLVEKGLLKKGDKKKIIVTQVEAMFANNIKEAVYGKHVSPLCQLCGGVDETVGDIVSKFPMLSQRECIKMKNDNISKVIH